MSKKKRRSAETATGSSAYLPNAAASATEFTGIAVTPPADEEEAEALSDTMGHVPVTGRKGGRKGR